MWVRLKGEAVVFLGGLHDGKMCVRVCVCACARMRVRQCTPLLCWRMRLPLGTVLFSCQIIIAFVPVKVYFAIAMTAFLKSCLFITAQAMQPCLLYCYTVCKTCTTHPDQFECSTTCKHVWCSLTYLITQHTADWCAVCWVSEALWSVWMQLGANMWSSLTYWL